MWCCRVARTGWRRASPVHPHPPHPRRDNVPSSICGGRQAVLLLVVVVVDARPPLFVGDPPRSKSSPPPPSTITLTRPARPSRSRQSVCLLTARRHPSPITTGGKRQTAGAKGRTPERRRPTPHLPPTDWRRSHLQPKDNKPTEPRVTYPRSTSDVVPLIHKPLVPAGCSGFENPRTGRPQPKL